MPPFGNRWRTYTTATFCNFSETGQQTLPGRFHQTNMQVFDKFKDNSRLKAYWDIPAYLATEEWAVLDKTDHLFRDRAGEATAKRAYEFYHDE